jgi:GST-like protein
MQTHLSPEPPHDRRPRLRAAQSLDLEQGEWRAVRQHQPPDRRPTHDKELPVGRHPLQLYSLATPNGVKVTVMLEELLALGHKGAEYDAWLIRIGNGDQFGSGFVDINPNSKIPALVDRSGPEPSQGVRVRLDPVLSRREVRRLPAEGRQDPHRSDVLAVLADGQRAVSWRRLRPFLRLRADQDRIRHRPLSRWRTKRQLDVLDRRLADNEYLAGNEYTIADIAVWPWYGALVKGLVYGAGEFLSVHEYKNVQRWTDQIAKRPAVKRGRMVNRVSGDPASQLHERHDASDFETKTQDKVESAAT